MRKCLIAAVSENNAIGRSGDMPWHLPEDLKYFKKTTSGCPVIMGRKTFDSIGRPLPKRTNIVISRGDSSAEGTLLAHSLKEAFELAQRHLGESGDCFIIGGGRVYADAISLADALYITHVHANIADADTFFPEINKSEWEEVSHSDLIIDSESGLEFDFVVYRRRS